MKRIIGFYNSPTPLSLLKRLEYEGVNRNQVTFKVIKFKTAYLYSAIMKG